MNLLDWHHEKEYEKTARKYKRLLSMGVKQARWRQLKLIAIIVIILNVCFTLPLLIMWAVLTGDWLFAAICYIIWSGQLYILGGA